MIRHTIDITQVHVDASVNARDEGIPNVSPLPVAVRFQFPEARMSFSTHYYNAWIHITEHDESYPQLGGYFVRRKLKDWLDRYYNYNEATPITILTVEDDSGRWAEIDTGGEIHMPQ